MTPVKVKVRSESVCIITMEAMDFLMLSTLEAKTYFDDDDKEKEWQKKASVCIF